jgi:hypothetical protein
VRVEPVFASCAHFLLGSGTLVPPHVLFVSCGVVATWFLRFLIWLQSFGGDSTDTVFSRERKGESNRPFARFCSVWAHLLHFRRVGERNFCSYVDVSSSQLATVYRHIHKSHGEKWESIISATICNSEMAIGFSLCMNRTTLLYLNRIVPLSEKLLLNYLFPLYLNCCY